MTRDDRLLRSIEEQVRLHSGSPPEGHDPFQQFRMGADLLLGQNPGGQQARLTEVHPQIRQQAATLLADLNSSDFRTRQAGMNGLRALGTRAIPYLREHADNPPSEEVRRRCEGLINTLVAQNGGVELDRYGRVRRICAVQTAGQIENGERPVNRPVVQYRAGSNEVESAEVLLPRIGGTDSMRLLLSRQDNGRFAQQEVIEDGWARRLNRLDDIEGVTVDARGNCLINLNGRFALRLSPNGEVEQVALR